MADEKKIIIDEDWKSQVQAEKEAAAKQPPAAPDSGSKPTAEPAAQARDSEPDDFPMPPASFDMLLSTLVTEAMLSLGQIPHPATGQPVFHPQQAKYIIESMASHYQGKVRNAEFWLMQLISKFGQAQIVGVSEESLKAARTKHGDAHANWEWWTAVNGASFHNLELAKESLARSVAASQDGIKILDDAIKAKQAPPGPSATAPAAAPPPTAAPK